jgi:hypothetical protein
VRINNSLIVVYVHQNLNEHYCNAKMAEVELFCFDTINAMGTGDQHSVCATFVTIKAFLYCLNFSSYMSPMHMFDDPEPPIPALGARTFPKTSLLSHNRRWLFDAWMISCVANIGSFRGSSLLEEYRSFTIIRCAFYFTRI